MSNRKIDAKGPQSEPGSEAAEPSPQSARQMDDVSEMYKKAARKLYDKGAADPRQAEKIVKRKSS